jgi:transposase
MAQPPTIGLDLAQNVFQGHGADTASAVVCHRPLRRSQLLVFFARLALCLVGVEACAGAHHRARELAGLGHVARVMPPAYAKPHVKRRKTDAVDAEAICEAVTGPSSSWSAPAD